MKCKKRNRYIFLSKNMNEFKIMLIGVENGAIT